MGSWPFSLGSVRVGVSGLFLLGQHLQSALPTPPSQRLEERVARATCLPVHSLNQGTPPQA